MQLFAVPEMKFITLHNTIVNKLFILLEGNILLMKDITILWRFFSIDKGFNGRRGLFLHTAENVKTL